MFLMLARIAARLREAVVVQETPAAGVRLQRVEQLAAFDILVPACIDVFARHASGERGPGAIGLVHKTREGIRISGRVLVAKAQEGQRIADAKEPQARHP